MSASISDVPLPLSRILHPDIQTTGRKYKADMMDFERTRTASTPARLKGCLSSRPSTYCTSTRRVGVQKANGWCNLSPNSDNQGTASTFEKQQLLDILYVARSSPISLEEFGANAVHFQECHVGQETGYLNPRAEHPSLDGGHVDRDSLVGWDGIEAIDEETEK